MVGSGAGGVAGWSVAPNRARVVCVHGVGLGTFTGGFGEASRLKRVDFHSGQSRLPKRHCQPPVIGAGRLEDDPGWIEGSQPIDEFGDPAWIVGEPPGGSARVNVDVQSLLADIDSDGDFGRARR